MTRSGSDSLPHSSTRWPVEPVSSHSHRLSFITYRLSLKLIYYDLLQRDLDMQEETLLYRMIIIFCCPFIRPMNLG